MNFDNKIAAHLCKSASEYGYVGSILLCYVLFYIVLFVAAKVSFVNVAVFLFCLFLGNGSFTSPNLETAMSFPRGHSILMHSKRKHIQVLVKCTDDLTKPFTFTVGTK